ncbi:MAG: PQQ-dependent sugar dehydrogenase [Aggregatilineales bacterium]
MSPRAGCLFSLILCLLSACAGQAPAAFRATQPPAATAPIYTLTPTWTPAPTRTITPTWTPSPTASFTPTATFTSSQTPSPSRTQPLYTLTPVSNAGAPPPFSGATPGLSPTDGWTCGDFPCADDISGFLRRIQVPERYRVSHYGRFPGQVQQIVLGPDGRLFATVLENGTRSGAVYALTPNGTPERYSETLISPVGLAFQPGTETLYVSARTTLESGGGLWRIDPGGGIPQPVITDLPCCFTIIDNQPNGMVFGPDGFLYLGIGATSDRAEPRPGRFSRFREVQPPEASIVRIDPHTGTLDVVAVGLRNPFDLTFDSRGQLFATDSGLVSGPGDRLLSIEAGAHYGWPYYGERGCLDCPPMPPGLRPAPDLLTFPDFSLPRGIVAYLGTGFPANMFDSLFVALWNGIEGAQRIVRVDPRRVGMDDYTPEPFVTGLIRPIDLVLNEDGALLVADYVYGHIWRISYEG